MYYLFSKNGWLTKASTFTSDRSQAALYDHDEAIERCILYQQNQMLVVPVSQLDLARIK